MAKQSHSKMQAWRREHRLTQAAAANIVGATRQQWWRWENGTEVPGAAYLIELHREGIASPNDFYDLPEWASGQSHRQVAA
jgi:DNA-binding XRE family transcriptional regulator